MRRYSVCLPVLLCCFYVFQLTAYNSVWSDEITYWNTNVKQAPDNFLAYHQLGQVYQKRYFVEEAEKAYVRSLELNPEHINTLNNLGLLHEYQMNYLVAIDYFDKAHQLSPNNEKISTNLSYLYLQEAKKNIALQKYLEAKKHLQKSLEVFPENAEATSLLSQINSI